MSKWISVDDSLPSDGTKVDVAVINWRGQPSRYSRWYREGGCWMNADGNPANSALVNYWAMEPALPATTLTTYLRYIAKAAPEEVRALCCDWNGDSRNYTVAALVVLCNELLKAKSSHEGAKIFVCPEAGYVWYSLADGSNHGFNPLVDASHLEDIKCVVTEAGFSIECFVEGAALCKDGEPLRVFDGYEINKPEDEIPLLYCALRSASSIGVDPYDFPYLAKTSVEVLISY